MKVSRKLFLRRVVALLYISVGASLAYTASTASASLAAGIAGAVFCFVAWRAYVEWGPLSGLTVFQLLLGLFHLGLVVPVLVFGTPAPPWSALSLGSPYLPFSLSLYIISVSTLQAGGLWVAPIKAPVFSLRLVAEAKQAALFFWLIFLLSLMTYVVYGVYSGILTAGSRVHLLALRDSGAGQIFGLSRTMMITGMMGVLAFSGTRGMTVVCILATAALLPMLIIGQRGFFFVTLAATLVALGLRGVIIRLPILAAIAFAVLITIPLVRRMRGGVERFADGLLDPVYEMGQSLTAVVYTIQNLDAFRWAYQGGGTYLSGLARAVPNVGGLRAMVGGAAADSPAQLLKETSNAGGSGLGFSSIAEAYWNFGVLGPVIYFFFVGFFLIRMEAFALKSPYLLALYANALGAIFWTARADFYSVGRPLIWGSACVLLVIFTARTLYKRTRL